MREIFSMFVPARSMNITLIAEQIVDISPDTETNLNAPRIQQ